MKMECYAIRDVVTELFAPPFLAENDNTAIRTFETSRQKQPFPQDYELYLIGSYDTSSGIISPLGKPHVKPVLISDSAIQKNAGVVNE